MNTQVEYSTRASVASPAKAQHRVLLVGTRAFFWLRCLQAVAPGPRVDLRYLVEGVIAILREQGNLHPQWLRHATEALLAHVAYTAQAVHAVQGEPISGTGRLAAEGARARASGPSAGRGRNEDCKALQIGEAAFLWLKDQQGTTRNPRLDLRYLVEGALALINERTECLPQVVQRARQSLRDHLAELEHQPIEPFTLEYKQ